MLTVQHNKWIILRNSSHLFPCFWVCFFSVNLLDVKLNVKNPTLKLTWPDFPCSSVLPLHHPMRWPLSSAMGEINEAVVVLGKDIDNSHRCFKCDSLINYTLCLAKGLIEAWASSMDPLFSSCWNADWKLLWSDIYPVRLWGWKEREQRRSVVSGSTTEVKKERKLGVSGFLSFLNTTEQNPLWGRRRGRKGRVSGYVTQRAAFIYQILMSGWSAKEKRLLLAAL